VNIHENVQRAMMRPPSNHRDPWFPAFYLKLLEDTKVIFNTTSGTPIIFPGLRTLPDF
jgi:alanine-glyoxylate transaminase/serine-glyoxylate transaminase/serine-pyruvate transaminase